jgi:hypothetical protein
VNVVLSGLLGALIGAVLALFGVFALSVPTWISHGDVEPARFVLGAVVGALCGGGLGLWRQRRGGADHQDPPPGRAGG